MNNFAFYSPTEFVFGKGTESQTAELVKKYKGTKVMIVYGGGSVVRSGLLDKVKNTSTKQALLMWNWEVSNPTPPIQRCTKVSSWDVEKNRFPASGGRRFGYRYSQSHCNGYPLRRRFLGFLYK